MINLLPEEEKESLKQDKKLRLVLILGVLLVSTMICFCLILFFVQIMISADIDMQTASLQQKEREFKDYGLEELQIQLVDVNSTVVSLERFYEDQIYFTDILERIAGLVPEGIYLNTLSFNTAICEGEEKDCLIQVALSGFSADRSTLVNFKNNIEEEESFNEVDFPQSNWLKNTDVEFSFRFNVKNQE